MAAVESRARIGLIIPTSNRLSEEQFNRYAPEGVHVHTTRIRMTGPQRLSAEDLPGAVVHAAGLLADAKCDIIVFHCTGSSMEVGLEGDQKIVAAMEEATGRRATSTASALVDALHAVDARRIALVSPYASNEDEAAYLRSAGFDVGVDRPMRLPGSDAYVYTPPSFWVDATIEAADPQIDTYLLSCTNIQSMEVIEDLEQRLGRTVLTSNQATLWRCLRASGQDDVIPGLGRLFRIGQPAAVSA